MKYRIDLTRMQAGLLAMADAIRDLRRQLEHNANPREPGPAVAGEQLGDSNFTVPVADRGHERLVWTDLDIAADLRANAAAGLVRTNTSKKDK